MLCLKHVCGHSGHQIAVMVGVGRCTVAEPMRPAAVVGITWPAGERMFVDYAGQTAEVIDGATGEVRRAQVFVAVLARPNSLTPMHAGCSGCWAGLALLLVLSLLPMLEG